MGVFEFFSAAGQACLPPDGLLLWCCLALPGAVAAPWVSVVIPYKNAAATLAGAVASIRGQSLHQLEILLVDNGSTDGGPALARQLAAQDARIRLLEEPLPGVAHAANTGMAAATGAYVARLDADDTAFPDRLEKQLALLAADQSLGVASGMVEHWPGNFDSRGMALYVDWVNSLKTPREIYLNRFVELPVVNPSLMFRKELAATHGLYRQGPFPEDYDMVLRWLQAGVRFGKVPSPVIRWRDSPGRLTRTDSRYSPLAFFETKAAYAALWLKKKGLGEVYVWGAGKKAKRRSRELLAHGIGIAGRIDIDRGKIRQPADMYFEELPPKSRAAPGFFILVYVAKRGARDEISAFLKAKGYEAGLDFLAMA